MNYEIIVKPTFQREAKRLAKHYSSFKEDFVSLIDDLEQNPLLGTDLGHGLRKVRMKITSKGKGKSGGARVITFTLVVSQQDAVLNLLYIYDKADRASISEKEIEQLLKQNGLNCAIIVPYPLIYQIGLFTLTNTTKHLLFLLEQSLMPTIS